VTPVERRFSPAVVVAIWGIANTALIVLVGFIAVRSGPGLNIVLYAASATLVFALALLAWLVRRRHSRPLALGLRLPPRPAATVLLAVGAALIWLGLPFGAWLALSAVVPLTAALMLEISARRSSRG
jgi:uncharacterized protein (TIGR03382 family)